MRGARWFLWDIYIKIIVASTAVTAALALAISQVVHVEYLSTYYYALPMMIIIYLAIYSFNLTIPSRNMALSFNCRRADFFWWSQIAFIFTGVASIGSVWLAGVLPKLLGWGYAFSEEHTLMSGAPIYTEPGVCLFLLAVCLFLQPIGAAVGCLYDKSKAWATVFLVVVILVGMAGTVLLLFVGGGTIPEHITRTICGVTLAVLGVTCAGCEVYYYCSNAKAVVR